MRLHLRQLCLAAPGKQEAVDTLRQVFDMRPIHGSGDLSAYDLPARGPMSDAGRALLAQQGVENLLFAAGSDFIEILFPTRADTSVARFIERSGGFGTGYMVILQGDRVDRFAATAEATGTRVIHRAEYPAYDDIQFHPKDTGGALLSVASNLPVNEPAGAWYPAGQAWQQRTASSLVSAIAGARLHSRDPAPLARRWAALLDAEAKPDGQDWRIDLDGSALRFGTYADNECDAFCGLDLTTTDPDAIIASARALGLAASDGSIRCLGVTWHLAT